MTRLTIHIMDIVTFDTLYILDANNFSECYETKSYYFYFSSIQFYYLYLFNKAYVTIYIRSIYSHFEKEMQP